MCVCWACLGEGSSTFWRHPWRMLSQPVYSLPGLRGLKWLWWWGAGGIGGWGGEEGTFQPSIAWWLPDYHMLRLFHAASQFIPLWNKVFATWIQGVGWFLSPANWRHENQLLSAACEGLAAEWRQKQTKLKNKSKFEKCDHKRVFLEKEKKKKKNRQWNILTCVINADW